MLKYILVLISLAFLACSTEPSKVVVKPAPDVVKVVEVKAPASAPASVPASKPAVKPTTPPVAKAPTKLPAPPLKIK